MSLGHCGVNALQVEGVMNMEELSHLVQSTHQVLVVQYVHRHVVTPYCFIDGPTKRSHMIGTPPDETQTVGTRLQGFYSQDLHLILRDLHGLIVVHPPVRLVPGARVLAAVLGD